MGKKIHDSKYAIRDEAKTSIFEHIEVFYNRERLHPAQGYMSPYKYEKKLTQPKNVDILMLEGN